MSKVDNIIDIIKKILGTSKNISFKSFRPPSNEKRNKNLCNQSDNTLHHKLKLEQKWKVVYKKEKNFRQGFARKNKQT